jgi:D-alanyl-D-alanine carboxypeptidase
MANLIEDHLRDASTGEHVAPVLADAAEHPRPAVVAEPVARPPAKPVSLASAQTNEDARLPAAVQAYSSTATPRWSVASKLVQVAAERQEQAAAQPPAQADAAPSAPVQPAPSQAAGKVYTDRVPQKSTQTPAATPLPPTKAEAPKAIPTKVEPIKVEPTKVEPSKVEAAKAEAGNPQAAHLSDDAPTASIAARPKVAARLGWMIQLGAMPEEAKATELIERAKTSGVKQLSRAEPFTEKVTKDGATLFRARFAGFDEDAAQSACKLLKRSGFACFATRS